MEKIILLIREETKNYDNELDKLDELLKNDDLLKVSLSEFRENLFNLFLLILNDKQIKQKSSIIIGLHNLLRDCQHWKQDSVKEQDQLINQLLQLIEETIFNQNESIKIDLFKVILETSCINANAINYNNLIRIINLTTKLILETNQSNDTSFIIAIYTTISQIIENYILFFNENNKLDNQITIKNGYLEFSNTNELNYEINDKFLNLSNFLIDKFENVDEFKLKHFYLNTLLINLKCCSDNQNNVLINLDFKLKNFLIDKLTNFVFKLLDCKILKQVYFKLELKKPKEESDNKIDNKYFLDEKLIKLIYLICIELFKIYSEFRCLRPTLVTFTFKMCSSDNHYYVLNCLNHIFKNHYLLLKLFLLTNKNEILIDTSIIKVLLDCNKKGYYLNSSKLASQSIININCLIESYNRIIKEFNFPNHIISYKKLEQEINEFKTDRINSDYNFENFKNKLDDLLRSSDDESEEENFEKEIDKSNNFESSSNDELNSNSNSDLDRKLDQSHLERENALKFVQFLKQQIPILLKCKNMIKMDDLIQRLSSDYCKQIKSNDFIINADGIYVSFYCSLSLNYQFNCSLKKLNKKCDRNCDKNSNNQIKSEEQFIDDIHKSGFIVFLSTIFIKELYQQLMKINLFDNLTNEQFNKNDLNNIPPLIKLILDLENEKIYELIDYYKLDNLAGLNTINEDDRIQNSKLNLMNELFDCIWPYLLNNLSFILRKDFKSIDNHHHKLLNNQDFNQLSLELIFKTLNLTEQLIQIIYELNQIDKCLNIFDLFLNTILIDLNETINDKPINLVQISAILIIFKYSIQLSCRSPQIWKYVFSCSNYVSHLEHKIYSDKLNKNQNQNLLKYRKLIKNLPQHLTKKLSKSSDKKYEKNFIDLNNLNNLNNLDLNKSGSNSSINLIDCDLFNEYTIDYIDYDIERLEMEKQKTDLLNDENQIDKIIENHIKESKLIVQNDDFEIIINQLCKQSIKIFEDSALKLNLKYLLQFLDNLKSNSSRQLYSITNSTTDKNNKNKLMNYNCLLFDRFCESIIKIFKSSRPVYHLMKCLNSASEHLIETASFQFNEKIRKTSIFTLNDLISNFISAHNELEHFHFNETLFKPYETLLLLELCEQLCDQEMIISSICGFVEGYSTEIGSGWRSLFRALCGVRLLPNSDDLVNENLINQIDTITESKWSEQIECIRQLRVIVDIFDSFLKIRNFDVFTQGAIDCLNCLFKMLKKDKSELDLSDKIKTKNSFINLNLVSLKCLHQFQSTLEEFYSNQDLIIQKQKLNFTINLKTKSIQINHQELEFKKLKEEENLILEDHYVYYNYLTGLSTSIECCLIEHQSKIIEIYLESLNFLIQNQNIEFSVFCLNYIVFNCIQNWSNLLNKKLDNQSNESDLIINKIEFSNFKHFSIIVTNMIVELMKLDVQKNDKNTLMVYQFFALFIQLIIDDYNFMISTLSVSCIRHVFKESINYLNKEQCFIVIELFKNINKFNLKSFEKLINFFKDQSNVYGDNDISTNEIANLNLVGKLINEHDNLLGLEVELSNQLLTQSYLNNQIELIDNGHLTKLYTFNIDNETFSIKKLIRKLLFIDLSLKEIGGLIIGTLRKDYNIKEFTSFEFDKIQLMNIDYFDQLNLINLIDDIYLIINELDKNIKIKFILQKISMIQPLINFYQINSICYLLKFLVHFDRFIDLDEKTFNKENDEKKIKLLNKIGELIEKMILDYIQFKIDKKLMKLDEFKSIDIKANLKDKFIKYELNIINKNNIKLEITNDTFIYNDKKYFLNNKIITTKFNLKKCTNDLDTECYLVIYNRLINSILDLQLKLIDKHFIDTLIPFIPLNYLLFKTKNNDFFDKLNCWLIKFDSLYN